MDSELSIKSAAGESKSKRIDSAKSWLAIVLLTGIIILIYGLVIRPATAAQAGQEISPPAGTPSVPLGKVFTVLFLMLGPFKIIGPFAQMTRGIAPALARRIAYLATVFAALALLIAAFLGGTILRRFGTPLPILSLAAGIILFLVALVNIMQQFKPVIQPDEPAKTPVLNKATSFAFPTIVTPYGIAAVVVFLALTSDPPMRLVIGAIVLVILLINLISMLITPYVYRFLGIILQLLGAILGVIQVALGLQIIYNSIKEILK